MADSQLIIGGASGFWGEASLATGQLLTYPGLDFLVYDYLAEITMSILARARMKDQAFGFATDFVTAAMAPNLVALKKRNVRVLSNAGGVNPHACAAALREVAEKAGTDIKIAVVSGDDLSDRASDLVGVPGMFDGAKFPEPSSIASINAYLGAAPIAAALDAGADIVITGRCVDSALVLAACIHHFKWPLTDFDRLAAGSLAGHLLECGPQSTGGNFTDWELAGDPSTIGYPVAEICEKGDFTLTKPADTTGIVVPASVGKQLLYEIDDPQSYQLPDVICDFSEVTLSQAGRDRVHVSGACGRAPSGQLKVCATYQDGFRGGHVMQFNGRDARKKATTFAEMGLARARHRLSKLGADDYVDSCIEVAGGRPGKGVYEEVTVKTAVRHAESRAVGIFLQEVVGGALAAPPGLHFFTGAGRPRPSPVVRLFSFLIDANALSVQVYLEGTDIGFQAFSPCVSDDVAPRTRHVPKEASHEGALINCPLEKLAWARSGDKGNVANIGVIARHPVFLPWIWRSLDEKSVALAFSGWLEGDVDRYFLPGIHAMNIVLHDVLGGGGIASLRDDAQGKGYAQLLLALSIEIPQGVLVLAEAERDI